jgi:glycosyltransferase involved in cell wall biosynthesis
VSSRSGGLPEVAGDAAITLETVTPDAIAAAVGRLIADDGLRADYAARARRRVERSFHLQTQAQVLDRLYETVAGAPQQTWSRAAPAKAA